MQKYFEKLYRENSTEFYKVVSDNLQKEQKTFIITANPETFMLGQENQDFSKVLESNNTVIVPDGIGIVKAANSLGIPLTERITGVDLVSYLLNQANQMKKSIFLYGAKNEVLTAFVNKIKPEYPNINISGYYDGYSSQDDVVMEDMLKLKPDIVLVALGIPRQELLINKYYDRAQKGIFIGVGGSFDVLSGTKKRAPKIFVKCNLEWLYRIIKEPSRIKRFYRSNVRFIKIIHKLKKTGVTFEK